MQHFEEPLSTEKQSPNVNNLQPHQDALICICGKVIIEKPVTLPCGHKYHFRCAREKIFNVKTEICENEECLMCQKNKNNSQSDLSQNNECALEREEDEEVENENYQNLKFQKLKSKQINNITLLSNQTNTSFPQSSQNASHELSFKYQTPNTNKNSKRSRYSNNQDSNSTNKQNNFNTFLISPAQASFKNTQERVPFTDITAQINKKSPSPLYNSVKNKIIFENQDDSGKQTCPQTNQFNCNQANNQQYKNQMVSQPFTITNSDLAQNNIYQMNKFGSYIQVLGERIIQRSQEFKESQYSSLSSSSSSSFQNQFLDNKNKLQKFNLSSSDIYMQNVSLSDSSLVTNSFCQQYPSLFQSIPQTNVNNKMKYILNSSQVMKNSFNNSMASVGSDKENVRNITTRRTKNYVLQASFQEGVSYMCPDSLYTRLRKVSQENIAQGDPQQNERQSPLKENQEKEILTYPFQIELLNLYNTNENNNFKNTQDFLILFVHDQLSSTQRYLAMQSFYACLETYDHLSLAWMNSKTNQTFKSTSDYFFGKEMEQLICSEFMRLQPNKQSEVILKVDKEMLYRQNESLEEDKNNSKSPQKTISQFLKEQFSLLKVKRMIQHFVLIKAEDIQIDFQNELNDIENIIVSQINIPTKVLQLTDDTEFSKSCRDIFNAQIDESRRCNIKNLNISLEINPYFNNLLDLSLVNSQQIRAKAKKTTIRNIKQSSKSSYNLVTEEDEEIQDENNKIDDICEQIKESDDSMPELKTTFEFQIDFLKNDRELLLFEVIFSRNTSPNFTNAKLFNCNIRYDFIYAEQPNNQIEYSVNSQTGEFELSDSQNLMSFPPTFQDISQDLKNLYLIIAWVKDISHLRYDRRVMYSFWEYEVKQLGADIMQSQLIYNKYKQIFDSIAQKKQSKDFEEYKIFSEYYKNLSMENCN